MNPPSKRLKISHEPDQATISTENYDLNEEDWIYASDYLDGYHGYLLYWLNSTSSSSSWYLSNRQWNTPWALLLHPLDMGLQNIVLNMIQDGKLYKYE